MLNNLRHLEYIVAVARRGSLVEAAGDLNVSQSAVSAAIKAWETELGYDVFVRRPAKRLTLTALGREFVGHANVLLEQASAFSHASKGLKESESGELAVSCFSSFAGQFLPQLVAHLRSRHPDLTLTISEDDHPAIIRKLKSGRIQVGITYDIVRDKDITFTPLISSRPTAMMHADHPLARQRVVDLADFAGEDLITLDMPLISEYAVGLFAANGLQPPILRPVKTISLLRGLVQYRLGFSIGFFPVARDGDIGSGIRCRPVTNRVPSHQVVAATYRPLTVTRRVAMVIDACHAVFADNRLRWQKAG